MSDSLEDIFDGTAPDASSTATPSAQEHPAPDAPEATPPASSAAEPPAPDAKPQDAKPPEAAGKDTGAPPAPDDSDGRDPAFGRLRKERNDYREQLSAEKVERARLEERLAAAERAREALEAQYRQAPPTATNAPQSQPQVPNPAEDPAAYAAYVQGQANERVLMLSEAGARRAHGNDAVNEAVKWFEGNAKGTPLHAQILAQPDPWDALVAYHGRVKAQAEIGADPAAYRAKVEAEIRARLEAERAPQDPAPNAPPTRPNLPPSLAQTPNAGARSGPAFTTPDPIETLFG